jgi:hypothetical protein
MTLGTDDGTVLDPGPATRQAAAEAATGPSTGPASRGLSEATKTALSVAALLVVMARVTLHAADPLSNGDTWFHLAIGRHLLGSWSLTHPGGLSSFADVPWLPTQWSTEMLAAAFERWFGLPGVAWLFGALFLTLVLAVYALCRREAEALPATVATGFAVLGTTAALSARPQVVTLVLLVVVVSAWLRAERTGRVPWHLVPLTWVWATAHGMWTVGVVVGLVCCLGLVLQRAVDRGVALRMFAVPLLSVLAACLTPLGPRLLGTQLAVGQRAPMIGEWAATDFRETSAFVVALMAGVVVLRWALRGGVPWMRLLLLLLACGWAMLVSRMVACSAVIVAPLLASALQQLAAHARPVTPRILRTERSVLAAGTLALLAGLAFAVPHTAARPAGVPTVFGPRLAALPAGSPVAVEDATGAWIEWRYPELDPVIDGMFDAYPVSYIKRYSDYVDVAPGWQRFVRDSRARVAVLVAGSPLSDAMQHQLHWKVVQRTPGWLYLTAPGGA